MLEENSQAVFAIGQNAGSGFDTVTAGSLSLSHNASASWRLSRGAATSAYVSLNGSDSVTRGQFENHFQMINIQASGQAQFGRNSSATANLTLQGVRQATANAPRTGMSFNTSGNLGYFQQRVFDVPRLRYSALYSANESQFKSRLQGDIEAPRERVNQSFEQRLDYSIGRVGLRLQMRFAQVEGRRDALIFFSMMREFGGY